LRATTQRLINLNCLEFPSLSDLDKVADAPVGTASTIVDGLAILLPFTSRHDLERAFLGTKGRQDATLDLIQLIEVVEKSAVGEKTDILDPMKVSRQNSKVVNVDTHSQRVKEEQGHFNFIGEEQQPLALRPNEVAYSQVTKRSLRNAGAASTSFPFHSAHIDSGASSTNASSASTLFQGARRNETQSEAEKLAVEYRLIAQEYRARREQSLMQAAHAYRSLPGGGASKQLKGAAAWVYADEARRLDAKARAFSLKAAHATVRHRMLLNNTSNGSAVGSSRQGSSPGGVVDLHGFTVHESLSITKEALSAWWARSSSGNVHPLYIVTGVGRHSRGNVAMIRPAILKMLQRDGWIVNEQREGQIAVKGLR
jgi:DNA-nicking Smr family endonuclease